MSSSSSSSGKNHRPSSSQHVSAGCRQPERPTTKRRRAGAGSWWRRPLEALVGLSVAATILAGVKRSLHGGTTVVPPTSLGFLSTETSHSHPTILMKRPLSNHHTKRPSPSTPSSSTRTKIVAFADMAYRTIALRWYDQLTALGYDTHAIVAADQELFQSIRTLNHHLQNNATTYYYRVEHVGGPDCLLQQHYHNRAQEYRRRLFAVRWHYVLQQLQNGTHVLLTDADNEFHTHWPMSLAEDSDFDLHHAFEYGTPSFPRSAYAQWGFTVCGGMTWIRASPPSIQLLHELVHDKCRCATPTCHCRCDDQVVWNHLHLAHGVVWTNHSSSNSTALTGRCPNTGLRIALWDRNIAYRGPIPTHHSQCPTNNWVSMPLVPPGATKSDLTHLWDEACGGGIVP